MDIIKDEFSEKQKLSDLYLNGQIDHMIATSSSLDKSLVSDAYNLRNGVRNNADFEYLWEAYGLEFPSQLRHIPVLRSIFDSLVGQFINQPFKYNITCSDSASINYILDQRRDAILEDFKIDFESKLMAAAITKTNSPERKAEMDAYIKKITDKYKNGNFQSDLEIFAHNTMEWAIQRFGVKQKAVTMADDMITCGEGYYQVKVIQEGMKPLIKVVNPLNIFYTKTTDIKFVKDCPRVLIWEKIPVTEVWAVYGHLMKNADQKKFIGDYGDYIIDDDLEIVGYDFGSLEGNTDKALTEGKNNLNVPTVDVYYGEWKANTKVPIEVSESYNVTGTSIDKILKQKKRYKFRLDRYENTRIGAEIYVGGGKSKFVVRDPDDPSNCDLTVNGLCYNDRNGDPYSLVLKTKGISEKIDILHYHAENLLAISGTKAIMVNFPDIPAWMGASPTERIMKWLGYLKQGIALVDYSQEANGAGKFSQTGDVDLSMSNTILSIYQMLEYLEGTAYKITGVSRQSVGNITQTDGKGTTELAIQGSTVVNKPLFFTINLLVQSLITDIVNACRICYPKGIQGMLINGAEGQRIFSVQAGQFNLAHYNVFVNGEGDIERDIENVKLVATKLIDQGMLDAEISIDMVTLKSLSEIKRAVKNKLADTSAKEKEQMNGQLEQYKAEIEKLGKQVEKSAQDNLQLKTQEVGIKQQKVQSDAQFKDRELEQKGFIENEKLKNDDKRIDLEALQLAYKGNESSKEIRNN